MRARIACAPWVTSKASALLARLRFVDERYGGGARAKLLSALTPAQGAAISGELLPHAWAPYDLFIALCVEADRFFGRGDLELCVEMGRFAAEVNLSTIYKIFYRLGTPLFIFRKAARLWEVHYDSGRLLPVQEGQSALRIRMLDFDRPHRAHCLSVLGWAGRSVEMSGASVVSIEEDRCRLRGGGACAMRVTGR